MNTSGNRLWPAPRNAGLYKAPQRAWRALLACAIVVAALGLGAVSPMAGAGAGGSVLSANETLRNEQAIYSGNGYSFVMQGDGNAVIYKAMGGGRQPIWATNTPGRPGSHLAMQSDGNLVLYGPNGPFWASGVKGPNSYLVMQTDGNLVMYQSIPGGRRAVWASNTVQSTPPNPPPPPPPPAPVVKVATFNAAAGNEAYYGGFAATFESGTVGIANQEICGTRSKDVKNPQLMAWAHAGVKPEGCGQPSSWLYGNALRVSWSTSQPAIARVFSTVAPSDHRRGAICQRGILAGKWTTFCSTHLAQGGSSSDEARRGQQSELLQFVADVRRPGDALIVAGDFNSATTSRMSSNTLGLRRVTPTSMIDQIWTTGSGRGSWTTACSCSDHPRLYASIELR